MTAARRISANLRLCLSRHKTYDPFHRAFILRHFWLDRFFYFKFSLSTTTKSLVQLFETKIKRDGARKRG